MIFKHLSPEEFERLSLDERMGYLQRLMTAISRKFDETPKQQEARPHAGGPN